ncbi:MAG: amino acid ABC transporter substrate-binding protein [Acetobacterales bacterium]
MFGRLVLPAALLGAVFLAPVAHAADGPTVKAIKDRGALICGSDGTRPGISAPDSQGRWGGFDVEFCRAVAVAIFGDREKVRFIPLTPVQRFPALQSGEIDVLSRSTTKTLTRDTVLGFNFAPVHMYAHTALMVHKELGVTEGGQLDGASVCVPPGTTIERNIADFWTQKKISYRPVVIENLKELNDAYLAQRCDVMANFLPGLALIRAVQAPDPSAHVILPDVLVKEPLAMAVRHGDDRFFDIVTWTVYATFEAEEKGLTSKNIDEMRNSDDPEIQRMIGEKSDLGEKLGVQPDWVYQIVKQVGNFGEIWEANVGKDSPLGLDRGLNKLWRDGGVLYAPPFQ